MIRAVLFLLCVGLATSAQAQNVTIRSGEHPTFTRFVLDIPAGLSWALEPSEDAYDLTVGEEDLQVDLSRVFYRVPRDRVVALSQSGNTLRFSLACDCTAKAYVLRDRMLVVDVSDGVEPVAQAQTKPEPRPIRTSVQARATEFEFGDLLWKDRAPSSFFDPEMIRKTDGTVDAKPAAVTSQPTETQIRDEISSQVAHAATIGLLQPDQIEVAPKKVDRLDPNNVKRTVERKPAPHANLIFRNATTIVNANAPGTSVDPLTAVVCPDPDTLDVTSWGSDEPFNIQVSKQRIALYEEFDRNSSQAALKLAKTYIYFGFGQEALRSLETLSSEGPDVELLRALAEILEHLQVQTVDPFTNFVSCEGPFALWAALADEASQFELSDHRDGVLVALDALPVHLREYLAPVLASRATKVGAIELADRALRLSERARENPTPDHLLAAAELDVKTQNPEAAVEKLREVVTSNSGVSPQAVINLIETSFQQRSGMMEDTARLAEALAVELANTELGPGLLRAQTLSRAQLGEFTKAFEHLGVLALRNTPKQLQRTKEDVFQLLTEKASDADFVLHGFEPTMNTTVKDVSLTRAMADRFASIGLNDAARKGIGSIPLAQQTVDDKLLLAHLALTDRKPKQALSYIDRLTTPDAETTRARALEMIGDHNSAAALFASANQIADAERASWMAEDWAALTSSETSPFNVAATALAAQQTYPVEAGMIESGQSLLTETAKLRAALSAVVQADN